MLLLYLQIHLGNELLIYDKLYDLLFAQISITLNKFREYN